MIRRQTLFAAGFLLFAGVAAASDTAKERRWADQIVDALIEGEAVWLKAGGQEFLGIHTEGVGAGPGSAVILLHGIGVHPDWPQVIHPLRTRLPAWGWRTLSLQMPVLPNEASARDYASLFGEVAPRLDAGIEFLRAQGVEDIYILGHSLGSTMAAHYLAGADRGIQGFVAIGMDGGLEGTDLRTLDWVPGIGIPMLDVYGSRDSEGVLTAVPQREMEKGGQRGAAYSSRRIEDANHFFDGREDALLNAVSEWLGSRAAGEK